MTAAAFDTLKAAGGEQRQAEAILAGAYARRALQRAYPKLNEETPLALGDDQ